MADATSPNSCADDLKKHALKVFKEATKDCKDILLKIKFGMIKNYDDLNNHAISMFDSMSNENFTEEAKELFKPRCESPVLPDVAILTSVILAYAVAGKTNAALKVHRHMLATGVTPTSFTYAILIQALATDSSSDIKCVGHAKKYFLEMLDKGIKPHSASYMTVFNTIGCLESVEKAMEFLEQIQAKGFIPESNVYHFKEAHLKEAMNATKWYDDRSAW